MNEKAIKGMPCRGVIPRNRGCLLYCIDGRIVIGMQVLGLHSVYTDVTFAYFSLQIYYKSQRIYKTYYLMILM